MIKRHCWISTSLLVLFLVGVGVLVHLIAKPNFQRDGRAGRQFWEKNSIQKIAFQPVSNNAYKTTCEGCHFPYPPELLPGSSWRIILNRLPDHFGEQLSIAPNSRKAIQKYLTENGADRSSSKKSLKIMKSLNGNTPFRITEILYIQKKHRGIKPEVLNRKAIGSLSNCVACHKTAEQGNFDEDSVTIPH
jgi:hypothetical protein